MSIWKGRSYEDFNPGEEFKHWPGKTILDADNHWFTLLTLNSNPLHFDENHAKERGWEKVLVNSCYTLALVTGMSVHDISQNVMANLGFEQVRFTKPVYAGDTLYAETTILEKRISNSRPNHGIVAIETRGINQRGEIVMTLKRSILVPRRAQSGECDSPPPE